LKIFNLILYSCLMLMLPVISSAQVQVEEEVSTDSVNILQLSKNESEKSIALAMTANLLVPGLGHYYMGNEKVAFGFIASDVLFLFGAITCNQYSNNIFSSARAYAYKYANVQGGSGADDYFWQNVGTTMDSKGYNMIQELNRASETDEYLASNLQWKWSDDYYRTQYNGFIKKSMHYKVASNFFVGAMILNRLVSFVDMKIASGHDGKSIFSSLKFYPQYTAINGASGLTCTSEF